MAYFNTKGVISDFSEVQSGTTKSGKEWQRMTLILDVPSFQGAVYKMVFQVSGDHVKDVLLFNRGDKVEVGFSMYAREWNGKWYNNVDLVKISHEQGGVVANRDQPILADPGNDPDNDLPF